MFPSSHPPLWLTVAVCGCAFASGLALFAVVKANRLLSRRIAARKISEQGAIGTETAYEPYGRCGYCQASMVLTETRGGDTVPMCREQCWTKIGIGLLK